MCLCGPSGVLAWSALVFQYATGIPHPERESTARGSSTRYSQMALFPITDFDPIHVNGDWTRREIEQVESAVADVEGRELPLSADGTFALWVASRHTVGATRMCAASRLGAPLPARGPKHLGSRQKDPPIRPTDIPPSCCREPSFQDRIPPIYG